MRWWITAVCSVIALSAFAQYEMTAVATTTAPGNASTAHHKKWHPFHNPASITTSRNNTKNISGKVAATYFNRYATKELSTLCVNAQVNTRAADFGTAFSRFGIGAYNENIAGLAVSRSFTKYATVAVAIDYYFVSNQQINSTKGNVVAEIGLMSQPWSTLTIGMHIFNPFFTKVPTLQVHSIYSIAAAYTFAQKLTLMAQVDKDIDHDTFWHVGMEWDVAQWMTAAVGCSGAPFTPDVALSFDFYGIDITARVNRHNNLGYSTTCSIGYSF